MELVATATEASDDDVAAVSQIWTKTTSYLLERKELSEEAWSMVRCVGYKLLTMTVCTCGDENAVS